MEPSNDLIKIREMTKELVVLYVEDEKDIRFHMLSLLRILFKEVYAACDGLDGLELFHKYQFDLVITDIQMPNMNGLEMVESIRSTHPNIPIIITTAFSDQEYFIRSIDLKIDKYLLKPIEEDRAKQVFADIAWMIEDRRKAKEYEIQQLQEKINRLSERIIAQITESYFSPCIIYTEDTVRYFNDPFCTIFDAQELQRFLKKEEGKLPFDMIAGFMHSLEEYDTSDLSKNRISVSKRHGRKIYRIIRRDIHIDNEEEQSRIYFFIDITLEEYQKIKIKSYTEILEELVIRSRYCGKMNPSLPTSETNHTIETTPDSTRHINAEENRLLRRSHVHKTTAIEYVSELDDDILQELQELDELDKEFKESIYLLSEEGDMSALAQMAIQLETYAHEISMLFEFEDLSYAIRSLAKLFSEIETSIIDMKKMKKIILLLEGIQSDLADWRRLLFVTQEVLDIHYLDSSLFSACLQIEMLLSDAKEVESSEDELILF
ncbi:response regulator transcription factor [Sulfuricurvum sp.]|uniref:response regulator transcription factor n=1 Tax=Sulfuricurvum sp. TaxID=2025608 RepID=UPI002E32AE5E|nr:response regulator [Sulfuricurvum sp.]HEX5330947.1 response regulator [Sulfuricurvum sp.]